SVWARQVASLTLAARAAVRRPSRQCANASSGAGVWAWADSAADSAAESAAESAPLRNKVGRYRMRKGGMAPPESSGQPGTAVFGHHGAPAQLVFDAGPQAVRGLHVA